MATFLGIPVQTIYDWRCKGEGPPALKIGRRLRYKGDRRLRVARPADGGVTRGTARARSG
uniref:Helix-turn-helix domain-containing protein n=1 Tax=Janibacter limosus TaxID=53458 RepID=A0AC61U589_9MICO|nr:helix-turn-helix domain-containing protein [Janibacter limosus]